MVDVTLQKDVCDLVTPRAASPFASAIAAGAGNGAAVTGNTLQRSLNGLPHNAALVLLFSATLTAGKTLSLGTVLIQDSADGQNWQTYTTFTDPGVVATGPTNGGTVQGAVSLRSQMMGARDYVRVLFTPTLNATATDTATVAALWVLAGFDRLPSPR